MPQISDEQAEAMRRRLIDAAVTVVFDRGTEKATSREILKEAGLSAGALYHYFPSKEALYEEVARYHAGVDSGGPDPAAMSAEELMALVVLAVEVMFDPHRRSITPLLRATGIHQPAVAEGMARYDQITVEQVGALNQAAADAGLFRSDADADTLTEMVAVFVEGYCLRSPQDAFASDRAAVVRLFLEAVCDRVLNPASELHDRFRAALLAVPDGFEGAAERPL
jgi:AcrR family transcriptional regulator